MKLASISTSRNLFKMDACISDAVSAAHRYYSGSNAQTGEALQSAIRELLSKASHDEGGCAALTTQHLQLKEFLGYSCIFLSSKSTSINLRIKLQQFLFLLASYNPRLRSYMSGELEILSCVYSCLSLSHSDNKVEATIESLRLMQVLTYDKNIQLSDSYSNSLVNLLVQEISREDEMTWLPFCLAVLNNLCIHCMPVRNIIRKHDIKSGLCRKLLLCLNHNIPNVVIHSLSLFRFLPDPLRDTVYSARNVPQTFQCLFNVLQKGESLLTRDTAVDLFISLLTDSQENNADILENVSKRGTQSSGFASSLANFRHLPKSLQHTASLLVKLAHSFQQLDKLYDLLLTLCSYTDLRQACCQATLESEPDPHRLTTPVLAMCSTAQLAFINVPAAPELPLKASKMLRICAQQMVEAGTRIQEYIPEETILQLIEMSCKTDVQTGADDVTLQCMRIVEGLRIAGVVSQDDGLRTDLLDVLSPQLCAHIAQFQMLSNPLDVHKGRVSTLPEWCCHGVEIMLELLSVLAALKDYNRGHKEQYWKLVKDPRMIPFLALAMTSGRDSLVSVAFSLLPHFSQWQNFSMDTLSELVAGYVRQKQTKGISHAHSLDSGLPGSAATGSVQSNGHSTGLPAINGEEKMIVQENMHDVDELISKMKNGMDVNDLKSTQMLQIFEAKIHSLQMEKLELNQLLQGKSELLQQNERLLHQYQSRAGGGTQMELSQLRNVMAEFENKIVSSEAEKKAVLEELNLCKMSLTETANALGQENARVGNLQMALESANREVESEKDLHVVLRKHYDELKGRFEMTTKKLFESEELITALRKQIRDLKDIQVKLETSLANKEDDICNYEKNFDQLQINNQALDNAKRKLEKQVSDLKDKNDNLQNEVSKISESIQRLLPRNNNQ